MAFPGLGFSIVMDSLGFFVVSLQVRQKYFARVVVAG